MNETKIKGAIIKLTKISLTHDNVLIGRVIIKNDDGIFPLVCFNSFIEKINKCKESDIIEAEGSLKDYHYEDYNGVLHFVKIILVTALSINGIKEELNLEEKITSEEIWERVKKDYQVLDVVEYERLSQREGDFDKCFQ